MSSKSHLISLLRQAAVPLGTPAQYDSILNAVGDASVVMIGEASHGTHEFYHHRAEITKKLIEEKGFDCVCIEGDWPDAYRINRYVRGEGKDIVGAFSGFRRFPTWMWRNTVTRDFAKWLRAHNENIVDDRYRVGFYGLDLYSLHASAQAVISYLQGIDPAVARRARMRYSCFDHFAADPQQYGMAAAFGLTPSCEEGAIKMLVEMQKKENEVLEKEGFVSIDQAFCARINAQVVRDAEEYYRSMFLRKNTWNMRDKHMTNTLNDLLEYIAKIRTKDLGQQEQEPQAQRDTRERPVKAVIWAHNSHLGDARYTEFSERGEKNVGQFVRKHYGLESTFNIGFTTFTGTVTAANEWDDPPETMQVKPADSDTYENLFHQVTVQEQERDAYILRFRTNPGSELEGNEKPLVDALDRAGSMMERAIGVIYRPRTERMSHLFSSRITKQFDSVIHIDKTTAIKPVEDAAL
jgi:erythromycin esterase-like protein